MKHAILAAAAIAFLVPSLTLAKGGAGGGYGNVIERRCSSDVQSFCASATREGEVVKCLARNQDKISHGCLVSVTKAACRQHMKKGTISPFPCG